MAIHPAQSADENDGELQLERKNQLAFNSAARPVASTRHWM
jgi:hypothetical protein